MSAAITDIAIIGMAGRFPGARDIAELWQKSQDFEATKKWILEDDVKRMPVAAQLFCDWLTLHRQHAKSDITRETNVVQIIDLLMAQRNIYLIYKNNMVVLKQL